MEEHVPPGVIRDAFAGLIPALEGKPTFVVSSSPSWDAARVVALGSRLITEWELPVRIEERADASGTRGAWFVPFDDVQNMTDEQLRTMIASSGRASLAELRDLTDDELRQIVSRTES